MIGQKNVDEIAENMTVFCAQGLLKFSELKREVPGIDTLKGFYAGYTAALLFLGYDEKLIQEANTKSINEIKKADFYKFLK